MYLRAAHADLHIPTLRQFMRANPLGILTTALPSSIYPTLQCSHIPWVLDVDDDTSETELGLLRGHMARANPHTKSIIETLSSKSSTQLEEDVMILFNEPVHHYVTPKFYTETKPSTGKVVPTWNYSAVQAYGKATVLFDSHSDETSSFLTKQLHDLSQQSETKIMGYDGLEGRAGPWTTAEAPQSYVNLLRSAIIGIEVRITTLEGKFKMSQELALGDRMGTIKGFKAMGTEAGDEMARMVEERGKLKDSAKGKASVGGS